MCLICEGRINEIGKVFKCCTKIKEIPNGLHIEFLSCSSCQYLIEIPIINGLKELNCFRCPLLREIKIGNIVMFRLSTINKNT